MGPLVYATRILFLLFGVMVAATGHGFFRKLYTDNECKFCGGPKAVHPFINLASPDMSTLEKQLLEFEQKVALSEFLYNNQMQEYFQDLVAILKQVLLRVD